MECDVREGSAARRCMRGRGRTHACEYAMGWTLLSARVRLGGLPEGFAFLSKQRHGILTITWASTTG